MLTCIQCGTEFEPTHHNQTKFCSKLCSRRSQRSKIDPEIKKAWGRKSYHLRKADPANIVKFILRHAKLRSQWRDIEFNITEEDIVTPEYCPILGVKLTKDDRRYGYSLDRIDPKLGYVRGNVWVVSQLANAMKWDSSHEERLAFANWVLSSEKE